MTIIDEVKQKYDIVDLVSGYIKLQKAGRNYKALCPFHSEKAPSFFVFPDQQRWHCFGACSTGGDIFSFIMRKEGIDFGQALALLAEKAGINIERDYNKNREIDKLKEVLFNINKEAAIYYNKALVNQAYGKVALEYLKGRGLANDIIDEFLLGYSGHGFDELSRYLINFGFSEQELLTAGLSIKNESGKLIDRFRHKIIFPICDVAGHYTGFGARVLDNSLPKYINTSQTPVFDKSSCLYGIDKAKVSIRDNNFVIVTEGYMDVITSHQYGWKNTVASMGTALTEKQINIIKRFTKNLIIALDSDIAGREATLRIAESFDIENYINNEIKVVVTASKDPDEEIKQNPDLWVKAINNAIPLIDFTFDFIMTKFDLETVNGKSLAVNEAMTIINKIKDPIKKGEYIHRLSRLLKINESDIRDAINRMKATGKKKEIKYSNKINAFNHFSTFGSDKLETNLISLLLQFPELRDKTAELTPEHFEKIENREIYSKWLQSSDFNTLKDNLSPSLHAYLDELLVKHYPPLDNLSGDKIKLLLTDYINRIQEKHLRFLLRKKEEVLSEMMKTNNEYIEINELIEQNIPEIGKMKNLFASRKNKNRITT